MDRDQRPANAMQDLRDLQRDVTQAQGSAGKREALTTASAGWIMPPMATPPPPAAGGHLFAGADGDPYWIDDTGLISPLKTVIPSAPDVTELTAASGTASDTINNVGGSYDQTVLNNNFRSLAAKINEVIDALQAVDLMDGT